MIECDADDRGGDRVGHVRGVETRAEADLEHGDVDVLAAEVHEGGGGERFEERGVGGEGAAADESLGGGAYGAHRDLEVVVGHVPPVDGDALVDAHEVG